MHVIDPSTWKTIDDVPVVTGEDAQSALEARSELSPPGRRLTPRERAEYLQRVAKLVRADAERLSRIISHEEGKPRPYAEATQRVIDEEVATLLREAEQRATIMLTNHRRALDRLTELLPERETIDGADVAGILGRIPGNRGEPAGATASTSYP